MSGESATGAEVDSRFSIRLPAQHRALAGLRRALMSWLAGHQPTPVAPEDVILAVHEAVANATEHAYHGRGTSSDDVLVTCHWREDHGLSCTVADRGGWRSPSAPGDRGRGLSLIRSLADAVDVRTSESGTTVVMTWQPSRTA